MGATDKQKDLVKASWEVLKKDWVNTTGPEFFVRLFNTYPYSKPYFASMQNMSDDEIRTSPKMKAHCTNFQAGVQSYVDNLSNPDALGGLMNTFAENHSRRKIKPEYLQDAYGLFVKYAQEAAHIDADTAAAWTAVFNMMHELIAARMAQLA